MLVQQPEQHISFSSAAAETWKHHQCLFQAACTIYSLHFLPVKISIILLSDSQTPNREKNAHAINSQELTSTKLEGTCKLIKIYHPTYRTQNYLGYNLKTLKNKEQNQISTSLSSVYREDSSQNLTELLAHECLL